MLNRIGGMTTHPECVNLLKITLDSVLPQVDALYLYLYNFSTIPPFLNQYKNLYPILGDNYSADLNELAKMIFLEYLDKPSYCFTFDDNVIYPSNYTSTMMNVLNQFNNTVALTAGGSIIPDIATSYYERSHEFDYKIALPFHTAINLIDSASFAFHSSALDLKFTPNSSKGFLDLNVSLACIEKGVPMLAVKRPSDWLQMLTKRKNNMPDSKILATNDHWKLNYVKDVWHAFLQQQAMNNWYSFAIKNELDLDMCNFAMGGVTPLNWRFTAMTMNRLLNRFDKIYPSLKKK